MTTAFPSNPANGDDTEINGIRYVFNSTRNTWTPEEGAGGGAGQTLEAGDGIIINSDNEIEVDSAVVSLRFRRLTNDSDYDTLKAAYDSDTAAVGTFSMKPRTQQEENDLQTFITVLMPVVDENGDRFRSSGVDVNQIFHIIDTQTDSEWYIRKLTTQGEASKTTGDLDQQYDSFRARVQITADGTSEADGLTNGAPPDADGRVYNIPDPILDTAGVGIQELLFYEENTVAVDTDIVDNVTLSGTTLKITRVDDDTDNITLPSGGGDTVFEDYDALRYISLDSSDEDTEVSYTVDSDISNLGDTEVYILANLVSGTRVSYDIYWSRSSTAAINDRELQNATYLEISDGTNTGYFRVLGGKQASTGDNASDPDVVVLTVQRDPFQGTLDLSPHEQSASSFDAGPLTFKAAMRDVQAQYANRYIGGTGITITDSDSDGINKVKVVATGDSAANLDNDNAGFGIEISSNQINIDTDEAINTRFFKTESPNTGTAAIASGDDAISLGSASQATASDAIAMGQGARATGSGAVAIGNASLADTDNALASGNSARALGADSVSVGVAAVVASSHSNSSAIGHDATTTQANQVMLGGNAITDIRSGNSYTPSHDNSLTPKDYVDNRTSWIAGLDSDLEDVIHHDRITNSFTHRTSGNPQADEVTVDTTNYRLDFRNEDLNLLELNTATILNLNYNSKFGYYRIEDVSIGTTHTIIYLHPHQLGVSSDDSDTFAMIAANDTEATFVTIYADIKDKSDGEIWSAVVLGGTYGDPGQIEGNDYDLLTLQRGEYYRIYFDDREEISVWDGSGSALSDYTIIATKTY